ncbi:glycosyltransferase family 4 protein [Gramella jeungdoensis]|uniref:Glycosyltransferase family 4 protein n=1 Tax=Gramella jeungdoensis TaxID=708091 RepID=A0ABT0Z025_9FLAO|nr:glycosyltransferase family 4 protein [Gramella jeungdoensis]MCM8568753.1 glycosyltransferase family 4 protein [Gramella jeungdoensis]
MNLEPKILYIMSSYNLYGGTPKKTLDLMKYFKGNSSIYVYEDAFPEFKSKFEATGGSVYEGFYGRNLFAHLKRLLVIVDKEGINVIQTQFSMGEILGSLVKLFRPNVKLLIAFVGPFKPGWFKTILASIYYKWTDSFIYITEYVKGEKFSQFPELKKRRGNVIFNGSDRRISEDDNMVKLKANSLFDIAGLTEWKNIQILIEAINILVNERNLKEVFLYVAGDGDMKATLNQLTKKYQLEDHIFLLGYQSNVGQYLDSCDIFVHPAYAEGFGIVIPEAMFAKRPIIVSNAGALPELIENDVTGLVVDPHDKIAWADAIQNLISDKDKRICLAENAHAFAIKNFTVERFIKDYEETYHSILDEK